jgi:hypothetical protein
MLGLPEPELYDPRTLEGVAIRMGEQVTWDGTAWTPRSS